MHIQLSESDRIFLAMLGLFVLNGLLTALVAWEVERRLESMSMQLIAIRKILNDNGITGIAP